MQEHKSTTKGSVFHPKAHLLGIFQEGVYTMKGIGNKRESLSRRFMGSKNGQM